MHQLRQTVRALAEEVEDGELLENDGEIGLRFEPAAGLVTVVSVREAPETAFAPLIRVDVTTLLADDVDFDQETGRFLDKANAAAVCGAWEWYADRVVGLSASLLLDARRPGVSGALARQLVAIQVAEAMEGGVQFRDVSSTGRAPGVPAVAEVWPRTTDLNDVAALVQWRSSSDPGQRWPATEATTEYVECRVPSFVGDGVFDQNGEISIDTSPLVIVRTEHPRRGPGTMIQVHLPKPVRDAALVHRNDPAATQLGRMFGTSLGALMIDDRGEGPEVVYRAFLPDVLTSVARPGEATDFVVSAALGAVNATGVAAAVLGALTDERDPIETTEGLYIDKRVSALRAAVPAVPMEEDLVELAAPAVEVGHALLDRLAFDQLKITTAPFTRIDDGFVWLPTPYAQRVVASPVYASRRHEVSTVTVQTLLGRAPQAQLDALAVQCSEINSELPLSGLVVDDDRAVRLVSTTVVHEGVWWHRAPLIAILAALHANLAPRLVSELRHLALQRLADPALEDASRADYDSIVDVVPHLVEHGADPIASAGILSLVRARLLARPRARSMGDPDAGFPDTVVPLVGGTRAGGWEPPLGEVAIFLEEVEDASAGRAVQILAHPGSPLPEDTDLPRLAAQLTRWSHDHVHGPFAPAWIDNARTVATTMTVPWIALSMTAEENAAIMLEQAIDACVIQLAAAVWTFPDLFPLFDRSLAYEADSTTPRLDGVPDLAIWPSDANVISLAFCTVRDHPDRDHPDRWARSRVIGDARRALVSWLQTSAPGESFADEHCDLLLSRRPDGVLMTVDRISTYAVPEEHLSRLTALLRHPEAAGAGRASSPVVVTPVELFVAEDVVFVLPPAPAVLRMFDSQVSFDGVTTLTNDSLWFGLRSSLGTVQVDVIRAPLQHLVRAAEHDGESSVPLRFMTPVEDPRVVERTRHREFSCLLSVAELRSAVMPRPQPAESDS